MMGNEIGPELEEGAKVLLLRQPVDPESIMMIEMGTGEDQPSVEEYIEERTQKIQRAFEVGYLTAAALYPERGADRIVVTVENIDDLPDHPPK